MDGATITLAGPGAMSHEGGPVAAASFTHPKDALAAPDGPIFVTYNHSSRKISTRGIVTTIAGVHLNGIAEGRGDGDRFLCALEYGTHSERHTRCLRCAQRSAAESGPQTKGM